MTLNLGCGANKITGAVNLDIDAKMKPDIIGNVYSLPFPDDSVDKVLLFHTIEHVRESEHRTLLSELRRVLKIGATLLVSYPEFVVCAKYFTENYLGMREFWKKTIYGRQASFGDYHIALMYTPSFLQLLRESGFCELEHHPEPEKGQQCYTVVRAKKMAKKPLDRAELYKKFIFNDATL